MSTHDCTPSSIKALAECPERFYLANVQKDDRRYARGVAANVGTLVHDALRRETVRLSREGALDKLTAKGLIAALEEPVAIDDAQLIHAHLDAAALAGAREMLKVVAKDVDLRATHRSPPGFEPMVEEKWNLDVGGVVVGGVWDRVDVHGDVVVVVDYKTGADVLDRDELRLDPQAGLYAAAAKARWPAAKSVRVEFHYLARGVVVGQEWTPDWDAWARQTARDHMHAVAWFTKKGRWAARSGRHCGDCPFRGTCRAYAKAITTKALPDLDKIEGLAATVEAFAQAKEVVSLHEKRKRDLEESLRAVLRERGEEFTAAGSRVRMGKRNTPRFPNHEHTLTRASELTGVALEELRRDCLVISSKRLDEKVDALDLTKQQKRTIKEAIDETGSLDVATWVETRALPDPFTAALEEDTGAPEAPAAAPRESLSGTPKEEAPISKAATAGDPTGVTTATPSPTTSGAQVAGPAAAAAVPATTPPTTSSGGSGESLPVVGPQPGVPVAAISPEPVVRTPGFCTSCGAAVVWGKTEKGRKCPFNADGASHFTTCPNAAKHSKKPREPKPHATDCTFVEGVFPCSCRKPRAKKTYPLATPAPKPFLAESSLDAATTGTTTPGAPATDQSATPASPSAPVAELKEAVLPW